MALKPTIDDETQEPKAGDFESIWPSAKFDAVVKHDACPICEAQRWWVFDTPMVTTVLPFRAPSTVPTYSRACVRCGYVQQFVRNVLDGELKEPTVP